MQAPCYRLGLTFVLPSRVKRTSWQASLPPKWNTYAVWNHFHLYNTEVCYVATSFLLNNCHFLGRFLSLKHHLSVSLSSCLSGGDCQPVRWNKSVSRRYGKERKFLSITWMISSSTEHAIRDKAHTCVHSRWWSYLLFVPSACVCLCFCACVGC